MISRFLSMAIQSTRFATSARMRITGSVDASTVSALLKALAKTKRRR
jgi:hypothetical protein